MEIINLNDLNSLCRVCLKKTDTMFNLFDTADSLHDTLTIITKIEVILIYTSNISVL